MMSVTLKSHGFDLYLQDVQFERAYDKEPNIIITASHNSSSNNLKPAFMSVAAWIEVGITSSQWVMKGFIYTCQMPVSK